jgi:hypothetical protein
MSQATVVRRQRFSVETLECIDTKPAIQRKCEQRVKPPSFVVNALALKPSSVLTPIQPFNASANNESN